MKQNSHLETGLKVGDWVSLIPETLAWKAEMTLQGKPSCQPEARSSCEAISDVPMAQAADLPSDLIKIGSEDPGTPKNQVGHRAYWRTPFWMR